MVVYHREGENLAESTNKEGLYRDVGFLSELEGCEAVASQLV